MDDNEIEQAAAVIRRSPIRWGQIRRTLILACSATKRKDPGLMQAIARYDGPAYRTLRARGNWHCDTTVHILSAEHGLISPWMEIEDYDRLLDRPRALELLESTEINLKRLDELGALKGPILVWGGELYRQVILCSAVGAGLAPSRFHYSSGGIGEQLGQLKRFLQGGDAW